MPSPADPRPNIVLVLADDMGFSDVGCFGSEIRPPGHSPPRPGLPAYNEVWELEATNVVTRAENR